MNSTRGGSSNLANNTQTSLSLENNNGLRMIALKFPQFSSILNNIPLEPFQSLVKQSPLLNPGFPVRMGTLYICDSSSESPKQAST